MAKSTTLAAPIDDPQDSSSELIIISSTEINQIIASLDLETALESQSKVFKQFSHPSPSVPPAIQTPHRITLQSDDVTSLYMPSRVAGAGGMGTKIVSLPKEGGQGLSGSTILVDEVTGKVKALINARKLTALRNACGSALSLRALPTAKPPTNLLIFGSGGQAQAHAQLFLKLYKSITSCTFVVRRLSDRSTTLQKDVQKSFPDVKVSLGVSMYPSPSTEEEGEFNLSQAVHNANIIITVTPSTTPLFRYVDVTSQTHVILIGSYKPEMKEVDTELIKRAGLVVVDSREACLVEAGELIAVNLGREGMVEIGELLTETDGETVVVDGEGGKLVDKIRGSGDITIFKSVGLGIQDIAIANLILEEAEKMGLGTLVPDYD